MSYDQDYFPNETNERSFGFKVIMALVGLMVLTIAATRIYSLVSYEGVPLDPTVPHDPLWYNLSTIGLSIMAFIGIILTWNFRKIGVYLVVAGLFTIVMINPEFELFKTLAPLFTLFVFTGYGFFEIVPKWKFFK